VVARARRDLKIRIARTLRNYYKAFAIRGQCEQLGNLDLVAVAEIVMQQCLNWLRMLRFAQIYAGWPQLVAATPV